MKKEKDVSNFNENKPIFQADWRYIRLNIFNSTAFKVKCQSVYIIIKNKNENF